MVFLRVKTGTLIGCYLVLRSIGMVEIGLRSRNKLRRCIDFAKTPMYFASSLYKQISRELSKDVNDWLRMAVNSRVDSGKYIPLSRKSG